LAKVNLLKPEIGGNTAFIPRLSFGRTQKFLFLLGAICFLAGLLTIIHTAYQKRNLHYINSEYKEAEKLEKDIGVMHREKDKLNKEIELLSGYLQRDIDWFTKLDQIRNIIPKEVWLKKLSLGKEKDKEFSLTLSGALLPSPNATSIATLSNFMNQLKENKNFFSGFDNPILADVKSETKDNVETMSFIIEIPMAKKESRLLNEINQ